jgi:hypothetical protein
MLAQETPRGAEILSKMEDKSQNRPLVVIREREVAKKFTIGRLDGEGAAEICYVSNTPCARSFAMSDERSARTADDCG